MVDDTDYPKRGIRTEMIGKVFSHVEHKMILGFKGLFLGITDGATQMLMDFCLVGEKGKKGTYNLKQKQLDARFKKERNEDSHTAKRIKEYDESKIKLMIEMIKRLISEKYTLITSSQIAGSPALRLSDSLPPAISKCHYLGMIKMGKTKYHYNRKDYTAKALVALLTIPRRDASLAVILAATTSPWMLSSQGKVRLFFTKRNKKSEWNALITTNTELEFKEAYRIYSMRWSYGGGFKDRKATFGLASFKCETFLPTMHCTAPLPRHKHTPPAPPPTFLSLGDSSTTIIAIYLTFFEIDTNQEIIEKFKKFLRRKFFFFQNENLKIIQYLFYLINDL